MRTRGFTLLELMTALATIAMLVLGSVSLMHTSMKSFKRTTTDSDISSDNAQTVRRMVENLRNALTVTVSNSGTRIDYVLPKYTSAADPNTGEKELIVPLQADGVARAYVVDMAKGTVTDTVSNAVVLKNVAASDPDPESLLYGKAYVPFVISTVGSAKAVTVNLITLNKLVDEDRFARYKTTVVVQNAK